MSKKAVIIFTRSVSRHYFRGKGAGRVPVTLAAIRRLIRAGKPYKVYSERTGRDITAKATAHALAYQYVKKRRFIADTKRVAKVLTKV